MLPWCVMVTYFLGKEVTMVRIHLGAPGNALVAQLVEATVLEAVQCQFESDRGHQFNG